jgi:hypothetical protein
MMLGRWVLLLSGLLLLPVLLIRAQPAESDAARVFLSQDADCPMPCFMGIQPGVTGAEQAAALLHQHAWVQDLVVSRPYELEADSIAGLRWQWTDAAPAYLRLPDGFGAITMKDEIVDTIYFATSIPLGRLLLAYGPPDETQAILSQYEGRNLRVLYDDHAFSAMVAFDGCPSLSALPTTPTTVYIARRVASQGRLIFDQYRAWPIVRDVFQCSGF